MKHQELNVRMWRVAVVVMACAMLLNGQGREPTAAERAAVNHYRDTIHELIQQMRDENWADTMDYEIQDDFRVVGNASSPLSITDMIQMSSQIKPDSKLYAQEIAPIAKQLQSMTDPAAMARLVAQLKMDHFTVQFHFNVIDASVDPPPPGNPDLHVPGAAFAYRIKNYMFDKGTSVVLLFGGWKAAAWKSGDNTYAFKFRGGRAAAIENIVVQLDGSPERINELLRNVKWQQVNGALTQ